MPLLLSTPSRRTSTRSPTSHALLLILAGNRRSSGSASACRDLLVSASEDEACLEMRRSGVYKSVVVALNNFCHSCQSISSCRFLLHASVVAHEHTASKMKFLSRDANATMLKRLRIISQMLPTPNSKLRAPTFKLPPLNSELTLAASKHGSQPQPTISQLHTASSLFQPQFQLPCSEMRTSRSRSGNKQTAKYLLSVPSSLGPSNIIRPSSNDG